MSKSITTTSAGTGSGPRENRNADARASEIAAAIPEEHRELRLGPDESPAAGIARVSAALVADARIEHGRRPLDTEVHDLRLTVKRLRALLRLLRAALDGDDYRHRNASLRDTARTLAPLRDRQVALERLEKLRRKHADRRTRKALEHAIAERAPAIAEAPSPAALNGDSITRQAILALEEFVAPFHAEILEPGDHTTLGTSGLAATYRHARRQLSRWKKSGRRAHAHDFRKVVKALMFQADFVQPLDPARFETLRERLSDLGHLLGRHHDLVMLDAEIRALDPVGGFTAADQEKILDLLGARLRKLEDRSRKAGRKLFAPSPKKFTASLRKLCERRGSRS